jgi:multiple sugar transport system substrate-binding protein
MKKEHVLFIGLFFLFSAFLVWSGGEQEQTETKEPVTITMMVYGGYGYEEVMEKKEPEFESEHPGIKIDSVFIPYRQLREKLTMALSEETGSYDIVHSGTGWEAAYAKFFENIQPYIERDKFDLDDFVASARAIGLRMADEGERYGLPYRVASITHWYRKDIMDQIGMDPNTWIGIPGWESYLAACEKLKGTDMIEYPQVLSGMHMIPISLLRSTYIPSGKLWFNSKGEPQMKNEAGIRGVEIIEKIYSYGPRGSAALERPEAAQIFLAGDAALHISYPQFVTTKLEDPDASKIVGKWGATNLPGPVGLSSNGVYMVKASKNKEEAWEVMEWVTSTEVMAQAMIETGIPHARISSFGEPGIREEIPDLKAQLSAIMRGFLVGGHVFPAYGTWVHEAGRILVEYIWGDDMTIEETLDRIVDSWYMHNGEAVGKTEFLTYYEQHGLTPPNWRPSDEKIREAVDQIQ